MTLVDRPATAPASSGGQAGLRLRGNLRQYGMIAALVVIVVLFEILTDGILLKPLNVTNLIMQNGYVLVLAIGMMLVIINREIDLSVGSVAAFVGAVTGVAIVNWGLPWPVVVLAALATGGLIGAFQGFWVAYARIPSFIVTLGGMLLFRGLSMVVLQGQSIAPFPTGFRQLGSGFVPEFGAGDLHLVTILLGLAGAALIVWNDWRSRARRREYGLSVPALRWFALKAVAIVVVIGAFTWVLAVYQGLPVVGLVVIVLTVGYSFVTTSTVMGRHIYAVGGNERAAALSGIATKKTKFLVFVNMGVLAALAGLMFAARLNAATPKAGTNFELDAIAAAFIGGASASGGVGSVVGAIVGGLVMGVMNNGMSLLGLGVDWQQAIKGGVLMLAVAFDVYNKNKAK
ncbi:multiple monosaccharide ABC transporter permease [Microbispora sp. NPDC046933]|uniref:multiple monosaccharide ABC transporter permease n=1 Tax=Microbispora sp. NPDC046933 TaxID=3155618 RepID=UPI0033D9AF90